MDIMLLKTFQREITKQCEFAINSIMFIEDSLNDFENLEVNRIWYYVQNFLVSTANVSKILWGSKEKISESRKELRESLNVNGDSILKIRTFRNHFEHFDERLETWANSSERKNIMDSNIGSNFTGADPCDYLRNFDPDTLSITFKGEIYEIQPILDELLKLHEIAKRESAKNPYENFWK